MKMPALFAALAATAGAPAAYALEIAPDGTMPAAHPSASLPAPSGTAPVVPFGATPDWQNTLRIQVGGLAAGDLDGDGKPDLAVVAYQSNSFPPYEDWRNRVYFNTGTGLQAEPGWTSADQVHSGDAAIGDVNGDGFADLVVANGGSAYAPNSIYFGSATGLATSPGWQSNAPAWAVGMALVDIDGDGLLDLVTANQGRGSGDDFRPSYLFRNTAGTLATSPVTIGEVSIQNSVAAGDLDGDGDIDLGFARWVNFPSALHENASGSFAAVPWRTFGTGTGDRGIRFADMDGDGDLDVVIGLGNVIKIFRNDGAGVFTDVWTSAQTASHQDLLVADFDGDGRPDIVDIDFSTGRAYLYLNRDGLPATTPDWSYDAPGSGTALAAADFNGDGRLDLAIGYSGQPSVVVFLNQLPVEDAIFADGFDPVPQPGCTWNTAAGTPGGSLSTLGLWNGTLYAGGSLGGDVGGVSGGVVTVDPVTGIASPLATTELVDGFVTGFAPYDAGTGERLYIAGAFNGIAFGGNELPGSRGLVAWDGATTTTVPGSPFAADLTFAQAVTTWNDRLVVGGSRGAVDPPQKPLLSLWDGTDWTVYHEQFEGLVAPVILATEVFDGDLYFAGRFDRIRMTDGAGGQIVTESKNVMGFDGSAFFSVGGGVIRSGNPVSQVLALKTFDNGNGPALYIGGRFNASADGSQSLPAIARWDGTTLSAVGAGFPITGEIRGLVVHDDGGGPALFATGIFTTDTAGTPIRRLAKLVGSTWVEVAGGTGDNPGKAVSLPGGALAIGGSFTEVGATGVAGSGPANGLATLSCTAP